MRTIAIVFALAVIGAIAPAAPYGRGHLSTAVLLFAAALVALLGACLVSGWRSFESRALARIATVAPAGPAIPAFQPERRAATPIWIPVAAARASRASAAATTAWYARPVAETSAAGRIALGDRLATRRHEVAGSSASATVSASKAARPPRSKSLGVPS
jgi:hypothetical protein